MWSLYVPAENFFLLKQEARFCDGCAGKIKGSLCAKQQTIVSTGSRHFSTTEYSSILPSRGSTGRSSKWWPSSVRSSHESNASMVFSSCTAFLVTRNDGGSMARARKSAIGVLAGARSFVWRHSSCNGILRSSGVWYFCIALYRILENMW